MQKHKFNLIITFSLTFQAEVKKSRLEVCILEILLDHVKDDFHPLLEVSTKISESKIDAVDVLNESSCALTGEYALLLMRSIDQKLLVDLQDLSFGRDFLRFITVFIMHYCLPIMLQFNVKTVFQGEKKKKKP